MNYTYVTDYKDNNKYRKSFNELTEKTYGFNLEDWYQEGLWGDTYIPYSLLDGDKVIANVSANLMEFDRKGVIKNYVQIGTVMTDDDYRGQGLSRFLMEKVIEEYKNKSDGIYLFANDSVVNFYPKFGFEISQQYQFSKKIPLSKNITTIEVVDLTNKNHWNNFFDVVKGRISNCSFEMNNPGLTGFWTRWSKSVYYHPQEDAYVVADVNEGTLYIKEIFAEHKINLDAIISSFGDKIKEVTLGFTPCNSDGYSINEYKEEDSTLFILGSDLNNIEDMKLIFPILSHA